MRWIAVCAALAGGASAAQAQGYTGDLLFKDCGGVGGDPNSFCVGYVFGVASGMKNLSADAFCAPPDVGSNQTALVVRKWLADRPDLLHEPARFNVAWALADAFPCT